MSINIISLPACEADPDLDNPLPPLDDKDEVPSADEVLDSSILDCVLRLLVRDDCSLLDIRLDWPRPLRLDRPE